MTAKKLGFMNEKTSVPDNFDQMVGKAITALFQDTDDEVATVRTELTAEELKNRIAAYCATRPEIVACYLYGSRATGRERPGSDVDVAFLLAASTQTKDYFDLRMAYCVGLGEKLRLDFHPLVMNDAGEVVLGQVFGKGVVVYEQNTEALRSFRRHKLPLIAEFSYYIDMRLNKLRLRYGEKSHG